MKKYVQKGISLALVMTMSTWCLSGCGTTNTQSKKTEKKQTEASDTTGRNLEKFRFATPK